MLAGLVECRAAAMRLDALGCELDLDDVRVGVRALHATVRGRVLDRDLLDHLPARVIEPAKEGPGAQ